MHIQPVILCGGSGTRLWPLSRDLYPKQLIELIGEGSLLQQTVTRVSGMGEHVRSPLFICNEEHRFLLAEQLREQQCYENSIMLEPVGRNTAPAMTLAALAAISKDDVLLVMPADHVIEDIPAFQQAVYTGADFLKNNDNGIITFGIVPTGIETGYGYIQKGVTDDKGVAAVQRFVEKPDFDTAKAYVESGQFLWNSGLFMVRASVWLEQAQQCCPDIIAACTKAYTARKEDHDFIRVDADLFAKSPSDSIDYAVIEKTQAPIGVIPMDAGWSDVGAWSSLWAISEQDEQGNVIKGDVQVHGVTNSLLFSSGRLLSAVGLNDMVIVDTPDAVMVASKESVQDIKALVSTLKEQQRPETQLHRLVYRPWGFYDSIEHGENFQVKRIVVKPGAALSLQLHHHRSEHWVVVKGVAKVTCGDKVFDLMPNESTYIPVETKHRLENCTTEPVELIEVQSGDYLGEDDIVRFDDVYGRN